MLGSLPGQLAFRKHIYRLLVVIATTPDKTDQKNRLSLDESWAYKVAVVADLIARRVSAVVSDGAGLNLSQWRVLAAIGDADGRTASQVVEITPMDKGIVSRAVAALVERGLLRREASEQDGRVSHLWMTEDGQATYTTLLSALNAQNAHGDALLSKSDQAKLLGTLDRIIDGYPSA